MVVVVASLKGGVGKSTLAAALSILTSTPAVDYDPAASLTELLEPVCDPTAEEMLVLRFCGTRAGVEMVPATPEAYDVEVAIDIVSASKRIRDASKVIVDTGPAWNRFTIAALRAADVVLVPVSDSVLAEKGAEALVKRIQRLGVGAQVVLVPSLYDAKTWERVLYNRVKPLARRLNVEYVEVGLRRTFRLRDSTGAELAKKLTSWSVHPLPEVRRELRRVAEVAGL